jgi:hypothetical protein
MKVSEFKNKITGEYYYSAIPNKLKQIDDVEFISVVSESSPREVLIRRDSLEFIRVVPVR